MVDRLAKSLVELRKEVDEFSPNRDRSSDGWIGDASHASRNSDHNPWINDGKDRVVSAIDIDHDPAHGVDGAQIVKWFQRKRDPRIKYFIFNHYIYAGDGGPEPWMPRAYHGANGHTHHIHISVKPDKKHYDDGSEWDFDIPATLKQVKAGPVDPVWPTLRRGSEDSSAVKELQERLDIKADGVFGDDTEDAVMMFQKTHGLHPDGIVGRYTWEKLNA